MVEYNNRKQEWKTIFSENGVIVMSIKMSWNQYKSNYQNAACSLNASAKSSESTLLSAVMLLTAIQKMKKKQISAFDLLGKSFSDKRRLDFAKENFINESSKLYDEVGFNIFFSTIDSLEFSSISTIAESFDKMLDIMSGDYVNARTRAEKSNCSEDLLEWLIDAPINFMLKLEQFGIHRKKINTNVKYELHESNTLEGADNQDCSFYLYAA